MRRAAGWKWIDDRLRKSMGTRFVAFFIVVVCVLAENHSEGRRKFRDNVSDNGVEVVDEHMAEQVWNYCEKELKESTKTVKGFDSGLCHSSTVSYNGVELGSTLSAKRIIQKAIDDLPPEEKETILQCLREKNFPLLVLKDEQGTLSNMCQNLFSGSSSIPRRYLGGHRGKHRILSSGSAPGLASSPPDRSALSPVSEPSDTEYLSPSNIIYESPKTEKVSPNSFQSNYNGRKYLVAAIVAGMMAGLGFLALVILVCINRDGIPKDGLRDEKPLLNFSTSSISAGSSEKSSQIMSTSVGIERNAPSTAGGSSSDANYISSQAGFQSAEAHGKTALPLPPGRAGAGAVAEATPTPTPTPPPPPSVSPPPPPKLPAPAPPPPPTGRRPPPPNPPLPTRPSRFGSHHRRTSTGGTSDVSDDSEAPKTKLKPFFWDKVLASPDQSMVWHEIKAGSFQFNEEMMEALFGYTTTDKKKNDQRKASSSESTTQFIQIIDPKKAQNLAILLKALNVTTGEVCDALKEGNELPAEFIQTLLKMAPTAEEELKLRLYGGELSHLGPAESFLKAVVDIPFAFKRLESLLFMGTFVEEMTSIKDSLAILEVACKELRSSRLFLKLLEAVLKTGNRMNDGTYRGGAQAFKLDTLLKLSDVKGTDGKTTLLHFVVHEIIRGEGVRAARKLRESQSMSSVKTEDLFEDPSHETAEYHRNLGLQVVSGLSNELQNVKKAALIDIEILSESVSKLSQARAKTKEFLDTEMKGLDDETEYFNALTSFVNQCESNITSLMEEDKRIMALVKSTGDYFHGQAGRDDGAHLFVIVRDFLLMVDKACLDVKNSTKLPSKTTPRKDTLASSSSSPSTESTSESTHEMHRRLFPAMRERQMEDNDLSSDDES